MPLYEYRCADCGLMSTALRGVSERNQPLACECGNVATRVVSRPSVHLSNLSKVEKADPKYDKMVDQAMRNTQHAEPDRHLRRMKPISGGGDT